MALRPPNPQAVVLFGASGDLAKKKVIRPCTTWPSRVCSPNGIA